MKVYASFSSLEHVISQTMISLESKYVAECMIQNNRHLHLPDKSISLMVVNKR